MRWNYPSLIPFPQLPNCMKILGSFAFSSWPNGNLSPAGAQDSQRGPKLNENENGGKEVKVPLDSLTFHSQRENGGYVESVTFENNPKLNEIPF